MLERIKPYLSCPIRRESLQGHATPNRKRGDLACEAGTEIFLGILPGAVHQDEAFEVERGEISCRAFEPFFACMQQMKSADDGTDGNVRTGSPAGFDRIDDSGMAAARDQHAGGQQERLFLRDEIRRRA